MPDMHPFYRAYMCVRDYYNLGDEWINTPFEAFIVANVQDSIEILEQNTVSFTHP